MNEIDFREGTLIRATMLQAPAQLAQLIIWTREYFAESGLNWAQPPIPANVSSFLPCTLLITDRTYRSGRKQIGRIRFLRDVYGDDVKNCFYDQEWTISGGD